jgi:predicted O-methyltransferase YrrM
MDDRVGQVLAEYELLIQAERDGSPSPISGGQRDTRIRAIPSETGRFLNILARSLDAPLMLELGTSYGYSGIWLGEAARATGGRLITMEMEGYKSDYAREMAEKAGLGDHIEHRVGDALEMIAELPDGLDFVFVDLWKDLYAPCLDAFYPKLNAGAIIVADNMLRPGGAGVQRYAEAIRTKPRLESVLLPIGSGLEVTRVLPG